MRYSLGLVYLLDNTWSFRGGFAYDESPVPSPVRLTARIPDPDRYWLAFGIRDSPDVADPRRPVVRPHLRAPGVHAEPDPVTGARLIGNFNANANLFRLPAHLRRRLDLQRPLWDANRG